MTDSQASEGAKAEAARLVGWMRQNALLRNYKFDILVQSQIESALDRVSRERTRQALDLLGRLLAQADRAAEREPWPWKDHACRGCAGDRVVGDGTFVCARHAARALLSDGESVASEEKEK